MTQQEKATEHAFSDFVQCVHKIGYTLSIGGEIDHLVTDANSKLNTLKKTAEKKESDNV